MDEYIRDWRSGATEASSFCSCFRQLGTMQIVEGRIGKVCYKDLSVYKIFCEYIFVFEFSFYTFVLSVDFFGLREFIHFHYGCGAIDMSVRLTLKTPKITSKQHTNRKSSGDSASINCCNDWCFLEA